MHFTIFHIGLMLAVGLTIAQAAITGFSAQQSSVEGDTLADVDNIITAAQVETSVDVQEASQIQSQVAGIIETAAADVDEVAPRRVELPQITVCDPAECPETCAEPNTVALGDMQPQQQTRADGSTCVCMCAKLEGKQCSSHGQCMIGTSCEAPDDVTKMEDTSMGICKDKCRIKTDCPQFYRCRVNINGEPECYCEQFVCTDHPVSPVDAIRTVQGQTISQQFRNRCELINAKCMQDAAGIRLDERWTDNKQPIKL